MKWLFVKQYLKSYLNCCPSVRILEDIGKKYWFGSHNELTTFLGEVAGADYGLVQLLQ